jgi:hypothetical protein
LKLDVVVSTMFLDLLEITEAITGLLTPLFAKAWLKALHRARELKKA